MIISVEPNLEKANHHLTGAAVALGALMVIPEAAISEKRKYAAMYANNVSEAIRWLQYSIDFMEKEGLVTKGVLGLSDPISLEEDALLQKLKHTEDERDIYWSLLTKEQQEEWLEAGTFVTEDQE